MSAELHVVREANLRDIPATLRALADSIETNDGGQATRCVVIWAADEIEVSYMGEGEAFPNTVCLLHEGLHRMMSL